MDRVSAVLVRLLDASSICRTTSWTLEKNMSSETHNPDRPVRLKGNRTLTVDEAAEALNEAADLIETMGTHRSMDSIVVDMRDKWMLNYYPMWA